MEYGMAFYRSESKGHDDHGITAIAIDGDKNSQTAVKWAADNLVNPKNPLCILIHVECKSLHYGDYAAHIPKEGRSPTQQELQEFYLPYRGFCARRGIETKEVVIHDIDVSSALADYIVQNNITNIVVGASRRNALTRKFRHPDTPSTLLKSAPDFCAVYVIAKGRVQAFRLARRPLTPSNSSQSSPQNQSPTSTSNSSSTKQHYHWEPHQNPSSPLFGSQISLYESGKSEGYDRMSPTRSSESVHTAYYDKYGFSFKTDSPTTLADCHLSEFLRKDSMSDDSEFLSGPISNLSANESYENIDFSPRSDISRNSDSSQLAHLLDAEMRRLKLELQQSMQLFSSVTKEAVLAKQMVRELNRLRTLGTWQSEDMTMVEGATLTLAEMEKQKKIVALEAEQAAKKLADLEAQKRNAEIRAQHEAEERTRNIETSADDDLRCRRYTMDEIEVATEHFSNSHKIGEGGYGPVFKGMLNHIAVAIKIVRPDLSQGQKQFRQEVDVLSNMRHPHMVILLGACPEYGCLVYEYMENGSLEDRLFRKGNTPPIPWRTRFRIAYEIATALLFLHETKPEPLVHRDLKPANILLDRNYVSKISDVGLARLVPPTVSNKISQYRLTAAAGTFCYIDPEYQQTGLLGVKSDLYSFGVVLLQILTAKPPMGLSYQVEESMEKGIFSAMLDPLLADWPVEDCLSLAKIAVKCCELRKKDRPDLAIVVLPELERLTNLATGIEFITTIRQSKPDDYLISEAQSSSASSEVSQYFKRMKVHL